MKPLLRNTTLLFAMGLAMLSVPGRAQDQDLGSLHQFNFLSQRGERFRIMLHTRTRFFNNIGEFSQFRAGPILYWDWKPKLQVQAGYYVGTQRSDDTFRTLQRPFAGTQIRVWSGHGLVSDWRTLANATYLAVLGISHVFGPEP